MNIGFSPEQWYQVRETYEAWWRGELERPLVQLVIGKSRRRKPLSRFMTNWPEELSEDQLVAFALEILEDQRLYGDALPSLVVNFGPGVAAAFTGARLRTAPDTVWFEPSEERDIADIQIELDAEKPWWQRVAWFTRTLVERLGDRAQISYTDIGGNLDILASLTRTDRLLTYLVDAPAEVDRCMRQVTRMWLEIHDRLDEIIAVNSPGRQAWAPTWAPGRTYMLQSDFCYMISPEMFGRFVMPDLRACCDRLDYSFYHMDGVGQLAHLDQILAIENLHGVQWVPGTGKPQASEWTDVLGKIRDAGKLCQVWADPQGACDIVRRHGGKGFLLYVSDNDMTDGEAKRLVKELTKA